MPDPGSSDLLMRCPPSPLFLAVSLIAAAPVAPPRPSPEPGVIRMVDDRGYRVRLDLRDQVLRVAIPEDRSFGVGEGGPAEAPILRRLRGSRDGFVSASILAQKAKQFDDGLYAAVELAVQGGAGRLGGKAAMLQAVARALADSGAGEPGTAPSILFAACQLGQVPVRVPVAIEPKVRSYVRNFLDDPLRSRPIGFYTWSGALAHIFRQDRMLQSELQGRLGVEALARALHSRPEARATYEGELRLAERLTNPLKIPDLRGALKQLDGGRLAAPERGLAFLPPSRSHEADLVMQLFGNRPIPEGFHLADEMIRRLRSGELKPEPTPRSGWYDHQTWALEPLVNPARMPESGRLELDESYRKQLIELFKGILALTRETHAKQLEIPAPGAAMPGERPPVIIHIRPELSAEPLVTHYRRRSESYRFVRDVLEEAFGPEALKQLHRLTAAGPVASDLDAELSQMQALTFGAYVTTSRQLGMEPEDKPSLGSGRGANADAKAFRTWAGSLAADPDVGRDVRMMVPLFYDQGRKKTRAWAVLGWAERPIDINFARLPAATVLKDGDPVPKEEAPELQFIPASHSLAYPVSAEVYVDRVLDRDEFRRLCDRYKTRSAILEHLK
jgi:hypothetical protein